MSEAVYSYAVFHGFDYRYRLDRWWGLGDRLVWVMLNPSSAGAPHDDPTIRRVVDFTHRTPFAGCVVVNLYGLIATEPEQLALSPDPVGPENEHWVRSVIEKPAPMIVVAWGASVEKAPDAETRISDVLGSAHRVGIQVVCLGTTKDGHPRHPLYVPSTTPLRGWPTREAADA